MRVNSIQFLRGVAALLVVYEHSMDVATRYGTSWQQKLYHLDNFGCIGVDLFFVISGFIITYVANKYSGFNDGTHFLQKRFNRINPVYYIATLLCLVVFLIQVNVYQAPSQLYTNNVIGSLVDSSIILPTSANVSSFSPLLIVGWTLSFEWLFYLIFFLLIISNVKRKLIFLLISILLLIGVGQILKPDDLRIQFLTNPILLEFVLGVIICHFYLHSSRIPTWLGSTLLLIGVISYLLLIRFGYGNVWFYLDTITGKQSLNKFFLWGIPSSCIVAGCVFLEKNGKLSRLFNNRLALLLGDASYSIYLIHYIILNGLSLIYFKTKFHWQGDIMIWLQLIIATVISVWFYKLVEVRLLNFLNRKKPGTMKVQQEPTKQPGDAKELATS